MAIKQNIEYITLLRCTAELISEISADSLSISARLLAQGLIPQALHGSPKASELVQHVTSKVKTFPGNFEVFVGILNEFPWLQEIVELIHKTYNEVKLEQERLIEPNEKEKSQSSGMVGKKRGLSPIIPESEGNTTSKKKRVKKMCPQHQKELMSSCNTCDIRICKDCINGEHSQHGYLVPPEERTESSLEPIKKEEKDLADGVSDVEARIEEVKEQGEQVKEKMKEEIVKLRDTLDERREELQKEVDQIVKEKVDTLTFQKEQLAMLQNQVISVIEFSRRSVQNGTDTNIKSTIEETLSKTQKFKKIPEIEADMHFESTKGMDFMTACKQYGKIKVNPADPEKCFAKGVRAAILNEETVIPIYTVDKEGNKNIYTQASTDVLTSTVVARGNVISSYVERKLGMNESKVIFKSHIRGVNHVQVKVNGENIQNIPCLVYVYTPTPTRQLIQVKNPNMLTVTDDDKIIVVGDSAKQVNIFSKKGEKIESFKIKGEKNPCPRGISMDGEFLFITDKTNHCVLKYKVDGTFIKSAGKKGSEPLGFKGRCGIAVNKLTGRVYIADQLNNRIQVLDSNLSFLHMFGTRGHQEKEFDHPRDVAVANNGTVYVSDMNNNRVQVFKANGEYIREFGNDHLYSPAGICVDSNDHILVADHDNHRVCVFNPDGEFLFSFGENGSEPGNFVALYGVAVDSDGVIYAADFGHDCVQIF